MKDVKIFYSWQSDTDQKLNHYFIRDSIKNAVKLLNKDPEIKERLEADSDTKGVSGTPSIVDTIFEKIDKSNIFICDVTIINDANENIRKVPNPNVLIELGYAIKSIGWDNIICIINSAFCKPEDLPFDIRGRRVYQYFLKEKAEKNDVKKTVERFFEKAILLILERGITNSNSENLDQKIQLDKMTLQQLKELLPINKGTIPYLRDKSFAGFSFEWNKLKPLEDLVQKAKNDPEFYFITDELESTRGKLIESANKLLNNLYRHSHSSFPDSPTAIIPPNLEIEKPEHFDRIVKIVHDSADGVIENYDKLMKQGKENLNKIYSR